MPLGQLNPWAIATEDLPPWGPCSAIIEALTLELEQAHAQPMPSSKDPAQPSVNTSLKGSIPPIIVAPFHMLSGRNVASSYHFGQHRVRTIPWS